MKHLILTISLILGATAASADERETWLCDGFKSTGDSSPAEGPFIMYGEYRKQYEWKFPKYDLHDKLEFVGENWVSSFDIYIGRMNDKDNFAHAYYFKKHLEGREIKQDIITIQQFVGVHNRGNPHYFETECLRQ